MFLATLRGPGQASVLASLYLRKPRLKVTCPRRSGQWWQSWSRIQMFWLVVQYLWVTLPERGLRIIIVLGRPLPGSSTVYQKQNRKYNVACPWGEVVRCCVILFPTVQRVTELENVQGKTTFSRGWGHFYMWIAKKAWNSFVQKGTLSCIYAIKV